MQSTPQIPKDELLTTPKTIVSQCMISPATYDETPVKIIIIDDATTVAGAISQTAGEPIHHDLNDLGDKIKRILPPLHPAGNLFIRGLSRE